MAAGALPVSDFETLDDATAHVEEVLLRIRLSSGLPTTALSTDEQTRAETAISDGLLSRDGERLVLTDRGRLLADAVVRDLLG